MKKATGKSLHEKCVWRNTTYTLIKPRRMTVSHRRKSTSSITAVWHCFTHRPLPLFISRLYVVDILFAACPRQQWSTVSGSVSSLAARQCPWPDYSDTDWTSSTANLPPGPTLYNVTEPRIAWLSSVLCHFQRNVFVVLGAFSWNSIQRRLARS